MKAAVGDYGTSPAYPSLPRGRHPLSRAYVDRYQRQRNMMAVAELANEKGLAGATVSGIAGPGPDLAENVLRVLCQPRRAPRLCLGGDRLLLVRVARGRSAGPAADESVAARVDALLGAVAAELNRAELVLIQALALGGKRGRRFHEIVVERIAALLETERPGECAGAIGMEAIASAIVGMIAYEIRRGEVDQIGALAEGVLRLRQLAAIGVEAL